MKLIVSPSSGLVLDLDTLPANPVKVDPLTGAPLDQAAVDHLFPEPVDSNQPSYQAQQMARKQCQADVEAVVVVRDSSTGRFADKEEAKRRPRETETEKVGRRRKSR